VGEVGDALPSSVVPLFRGWGTGASGSWWAWSGKVPLNHRRGGVRGRDSGHRIEVLLVLLR